jgi:hypothetical protein
MMSIECFKRCHLDAILVTVVIRKLNQWQTLVPAALVVHYASFENILQYLVLSLSLAICLWMIS